jgi:beta-phosphoglucomutase-like phosphatase (HAD superfamily)
MLERVGLKAYFEGRIAARDEVKAPKPAPDVYLLAASKLSARPCDCLAVEDSPTGIAAARAAGMRVIGFCPTSGVYGARDLFEAGATFVVHELIELLTYRRGGTSGQ